MNTTHLDIPIDGIYLKGDLRIPKYPKGLIVFSHGSGSSRLSPRNRFVAEELNREEFATLLFDLLTPREDSDYEQRFNIKLLTQRLIAVTKWLRSQPSYRKWNIGFFGASTGAASALRAAATLGPDVVKAVVSRGGRPDLAGDALELVKSPTLLIVGGYDTEVIELNEAACDRLNGVKELKIVPEASHLFEEPGKLEAVTELASAWFLKYLHRYRIEIEKDYMG